MCGEHEGVFAVAQGEQGSSPHVRGALEGACEHVHVEGIIPACAGSTRILAVRTLVNGDHPRMCGEHTPPRPVDPGEVGSSPHVRGARRRSCRRSWCRGIIPACAGSTTGQRTCQPVNRDHPRMCGEHVRGLWNGISDMGSSPHVRGALNESPILDTGAGIIPACAGSTNISTIISYIVRDHPRMCGEHLGFYVNALSSQGSSPHVRGAL